MSRSEIPLLITYLSNWSYTLFSSGEEDKQVLPNLVTFGCSFTILSLLPPPLSCLIHLCRLWRLARQVSVWRSCEEGQTERLSSEFAGARHGLPCPALLHSTSSYPARLFAYRRSFPVADSSCPSSLPWCAAVLEGPCLLISLSMLYRLSTPSMAVSQ